MNGVIRTVRYSGQTHADADLGCKCSLQQRQRRPGGRRPAADGLLHSVRRVLFQRMGISSLAIQLIVQLAVARCVDGAIEFDWRWRLSPDLCVEFDF